MPGDHPPDALTVEEVAELCGRDVEWVEARLGQAGYPTMMRSSDRFQWVTIRDARDWVALSDQERRRTAAREATA